MARAQKVEKKDIVLFIAIVTVGIIVYFVLFGRSESIQPPPADSTPEDTSVSDTPQETAQDVPPEDVPEGVPSASFDIIPDTRGGIPMEGGIPTIAFEEAFTDNDISYRAIGVSPNDPSIPDALDVERLSVATTGSDLYLRADMYGPVSDTALYIFHVPKNVKGMDGQVSYIVAVSGPKDTLTVHLQKLNPDKTSEMLSVGEIDAVEHPEYTVGILDAEKNGDVIEIQLGHGLLGITLDEVRLLPFVGFQVETYQDESAEEPADRLWE